MYGSKVKLMWFLLIVIGIISIAALGVALNQKSTTLNKQIYQLKSSGSSSVYPIWRQAQEIILNKFNVKLDISSTGSGNGVRDAYERKTDFGNASRNPKKSEVKEAATKWNTIKTVKLATDAIVIFIKMPNNCQQTTLSSTPDKIVKAYTGLSDASINKIATSQGKVSVFNGIITRGSVSVRVSNTQPTIDQLINSTCHQVIKLFTRNTTASGTRDAFLKIADKTMNSNLNWIKDEVFGEIVEERVKNNSLSTTNEANSAAKLAVSASSGGASYISYGFVSNNSNTVNASTNEGITAITFDKNQVVPSIETISNSQYLWSRNLNTLINTESKYIDKIIEILDFFRISYSGRHLIKQLGFIPIQASEIDINYKLPDVIAYSFKKQQLPWLD